MPRILVADDNPLSLRFFGDALAAFEVDCTPAADGLVALELAAREAFDLLLLDARMPGAGAIEVLAVIRAGTGPSRHAPALATTAASGDGAQVALRAAGFADVLTKPLPIAALRGALDTWLPAWRPHVVSEPRAAWLDDVRAMTVAGGDAAMVAALRGLLAGELERLPAELAAIGARGDEEALRERLHRVDASAGFCGVPALARAASILRDAARSPAWTQAALDDFLHTCARVRELLPQTGSGKTFGADGP